MRKPTTNALGFLRSQHSQATRLREI